MKTVKKITALLLALTYPIWFIPAGLVAFFYDCGKNAYDNILWHLDRRFPDSEEQA